KVIATGVLNGVVGAFEQKVTPPVVKGKSATARDKEGTTFATGNKAKRYADKIAKATFVEKNPGGVTSMSCSKNTEKRDAVVRRADRIGERIIEMPPPRTTDSNMSDLHTNFLEHR